LFLAGWPIQKIKIVGVVRAVARKRQLVLVVDDGTGIVDCTVFGGMGTEDFITDFVAEGGDDLSEGLGSGGIGKDPIVGDVVTICGKIKLPTNPDGYRAGETGENFGKELLVHTLKIHTGNSTNAEARLMLRQCEVLRDILSVAPDDPNKSIMQKLMRVKNFGRLVEENKLEVRKRQFVAGSGGGGKRKKGCTVCEGLVFSERLGG